MRHCGATCTVPEHVTLAYDVFCAISKESKDPHCIALHMSLAFFLFSSNGSAGSQLVSSSNCLMHTVPLQGELPSKNLSSSSENKYNGFVVMHVAHAI